MIYDNLEGEMMEAQSITGKIVDFDAVKLGDGDFNGIPIGITKDDLSVLQFP